MVVCPKSNVYERVIYPPTLTYTINITLPHISDSVVHVPEVRSVVNLLLPTISEEVVYNPSIAVGAVQIELPTITSEQLYPPHSIQAQRRVYTGVSYVFETVV